MIKYKPTFEEKCDFCRFVEFLKKDSSAFRSRRTKSGRFELEDKEWFELAHNIYLVDAKMRIPFGGKSKILNRIYESYRQFRMKNYKT